MGVSVGIVHNCSYLSRWDSRCSIRTRALKSVDFAQEGYFFPPDKQPLLLLDEVRSLGEDIKKEILIHTLYKYLSDIINLEVHLINRACTALIYHELPVKFTEEQRLSAYTVLIDEYYHVYLSRRLVNEIKSKYDVIDASTYPQSDAVKAVSVIQSRLSHQAQELFVIIAVCIFETTLVRELVEFFNAKDVHPSIKYYVNDHMNDESRHFAYFYDLLVYVWDNMSDELRQEVGGHLGEFIRLYLNIESDMTFNKMLYNKFVGTGSDKAVGALYRDFTISRDLPVVKNVIGVLEKSKIIEHPAVSASLELNILA